MTITEVEPQATTQTGDVHDLNHFVCCDPDRGLCGANVGGYTWDLDWIEEPEDCAICVDLLDAPCRALFCKTRSRFRGWFGRRNWGSSPP